jgi:hypothetical protein
MNWSSWIGIRLSPGFFQLCATIIAGLSGQLQASALADPVGPSVLQDLTRQAISKVCCLHKMRSQPLTGAPAAKPCVTHRLDCFLLACRRRL